MAGEIFFKSGSKSSITTEAPLTPSYKAGTVYFAIDDDNNGFIYLDYDNKRIPMTSVAEKASNDSADHSIVDHYVHSITSAANTLTYKDGDGDQLGTASIINSISNAWTNGTTAGPTIQTTVNGVSGTAVAIPSAGASASGVVTTGAQTFAGSKTFSSKIIGNLQGNADTATSATNDSSSHKIADWYVHSIAHSNNTLVYKDGDGDSLGSVAIPGAFFVKGTQTASTNAWTGALPSGVTQYYEGLSIAYFLPYAGTSSAATLNLGGLGAKPVILGENATGSTTTHYAAKNVIWMTYLTDSGVNSGNGYWKVSAHRNSTYYYTTAYCGTGAGTAAKAGSVSYYTLQPGYIPVMFIYDNTAQSALTLNINSTGAKPLYINGAVSSSSNYTIKRGVYIVHYDGNNYYLRTDDVIPGTIERAIADGNGNEILTTYASSLSASGNSLILKNKNGDTLSTVTVAASDTKVNVTLGTTSKAYILGTTTTPTATAAGVTSIADTGVYLGTTAGELVATKFTGDLAGNASTATLATKATGDANGNPILTTYASSLSGSGTTLTLKNKNGDTLSTVTTQDTKNTAGSTQDTSKLYLVGAKSQAASAQTYSSSKVYVTDDTLTAPTFAGDLTGNAATATLAAKATGDANGNPILTTYANSLTLSGNTLTLKNKNGDNLSQVTIAASDTKVNVTLGTTSKAYILGTTTTPTATAAGVTSIADTGVYLGTTAGELVATKFTGDLAGNAATATLASKATGDANGNPILSTYAGSLEVSGRTLTLKAKNGDTLSTVTTQDNDTKNTAGSTNSTSKLFLIGATSQAANPQTYSSSKVYVTDGTVTATTFSGNLSGNATSATTATTATYDSGNNEIESTYIKSISYSGNSATNAAGTAITAGSAGLVTMLTGDDTPSKIDIPAATASIAGVVGNGSQTWAGTKTFSTGVTIASGTSTKAVFNYSDIQAGTSDSARPVWFAWAGQNGTPVIDTDFTYNPSSNTLKATNFDGLATKATGDANGNPILSTYANSLTLSGNTLTLKNKNGDNLSQVTIAASDTKVNVTLGTTSKAYVLGTTTTPTSTAAGVTSIADTGVYLGTTAGELVATKFTGDLNGNAATATLASKATGDGNGNEIISKYASSLSVNGTTLTLKAKNGDTLSTVTTQDTKNTAGSSQKATKIYIIGAESQATSAQTYSSSKVYITDGTVTATTFSGALDGNAATATLATKATGDANGNPILTTYASSLSVSGTTLTLKNKNGDTLSTVTTQDNDTKNTAGSTNSTSKLFLIGATSQAANPQTYSSSKVYVTDGTVTATTFSGALSGNATSATTATSATNDSGSHKILDWYIHSISFDSSTSKLTYTDGDGDPTDVLLPFLLLNGGNVTGPVSFGDAVSMDTLTVGSLVSTGVATFTNGLIGNLTGNITGNAATATNAFNDGQGNLITSHYASSLTASGTTLTLKAKNGDTLSTVTTQDTKNTAGSTNSTSKLFLIGATSQANNPQTYSSSKVYVTDGTVTATTFSGALSGNASTATLAEKATGDGSGNEIISKYASSLEVSGTTLTLKAKNGDQLSQVTTQDTKNTAGSTQKATKIYIIGAESQANNPQTYSSSKVYITDGTVTATTFSGDLSGNASTATLATKATGDGQGNEIYSKYASSLSSANNTLTLKAKNGDTLSSPSIVNSIGHTWTGGTTAGPTLYITVNGQNSTASAVPSASASASGIVTTGDQSFAGIKTFTGNDVVISKTGPDPASTPVTFANRTSYPSLTFKDDSQYGSFIMTRYDSVFKPGVTLYFRSDQTYANFIASYLKAEEGLYAKYANTLITGGSKTAAVTTSPYVPEKWTFNTTVSPANGDIITIETPGGGHDYGVFLSVKDGDYYPIVLNGTGRLTTHYPQGTLLTLIFDSDQSATSIFPLGGGTARTTVTGGAWRVLNYYDSGNPGDWNLRQYTIKAASAITAIHAIGGTDSGYKPIDTGNAFDIRYAVLYAGSDIASAGTGNNNYVHHYSINLRNSSNSNISFTAYKNVYIKGIISGNTFTPYSTTNPYVQDITASDDGYVYYYIGRAYSTSAMTFDTTGRDIFVYKNGAIRKYSGNAENANYVNLYEARGSTTNLNKAANYVGAGAMFHLVASSSTTTGKCSFDANVLQMNWDNNGGYDSQLAISTSGSRMQIRSQASTGAAWREVVTTAAATETGSGVKPIYISNTGAVTASSSNAGSAYVPIYLNAGTLTQCSNPSMLTNLGSTTAASVFAASPRPGVTGVLGTANGGTGNSSFTASRAVYTESATKLSSSGHYMSSSKFAINSTSEPSYNLYINGTTYFNGNATYNGDIYQYSLNGQRWREHFYEATAGTSALGSGTQTFTVKGGRWGEVWYEYPRLTTTYATAGDATSTSTTATSGGIYYWRQWSYNSSTADRLSYYENFYLPTVTKDRTGNASYEIFTSKSYTTLDGRYLKLAGGTMTGQINRTAASLGGSWIASRDNAVISVDASDSTSSTAFSLARIKFSTKTYAIGSERAGNNFGIYGWLNSRTENGTDWSFYIGNDTYFHCSTRLYGAVWNDYAEYRSSDVTEPGRCVKEVGDDTLELATKRLELGCEIVSDTFGFAIGQTEKANTPIASNGRVLAYPLEDREEFRKNIGKPVCSGPNGTVSIMTEEEWQKYPHCIIGTISAIPDYETWGTENIQVNGRIWIRIR